MPIALLADRGVVRVSGEDARQFLDGLVTCDMDKVGEDRPRYGALLTPQGKIIADFLIVQEDGERGGAFYLDTPRIVAPDLAKRLGLYRLRAKVTVEDLSSTLSVLVRWDETPFPEGLGVVYADPRAASLGDRLIAEASVAGGLADAAASAWHERRIACGIPEGGADFAFGDAFPHEADMDQLGGVDFDKGCYVGQEVVSRMQHRGAVRTRVVPVAISGPLPSEGAEITAGGKPAGRIGSVSKAGTALALVRLDRVEDALAAGHPVEAHGAMLRVLRPFFARFPVPGEEAKGDG